VLRQERAQVVDAAVGFGLVVLARTKEEIRK
jgi:hypothetical protein